MLCDYLCLNNNNNNINNNNNNNNNKYRIGSYEGSSCASWAFYDR